MVWIEFLSVVIDLYIEPEIQDPVELVDARLHFLLEMHQKSGV